jgi:hypothetical protein
VEALHHRLIHVAFILLLSPLGAACSGETGPTEPRVSSDAARLSRLGLTTEIPGRVRSVCARASERATVRVICPELIPDVPLFTPGAGLHGDYSYRPTYYMLTFNNGDPPGPARHWIVGGGRAGAVEKWVLTDIANATKGDPELVERRDAGSREVSIYRFPPYPAGGPNGGHWAAFVRVGGGQVVFASLHGKQYVDAAVEMALSLAATAG